MTNKRVPFFALLALLLLVSVVYADVMRLGYQSIRGDGAAAYATDVTAVTSAAWSSPETPYYTRSNPQVCVSVESDTAGLAIELMLGLYHYDESADTYTFLGLSDAKSVTTSADQEVSAGVYTVEDYVEFETQAANAFDLRVITLATSTTGVDLKVWGKGVQPVLTAAPAAD